MNKDFIAGIVFSNMHDAKLPELTQIRSFGSVPFGGRYRLIDFVLSNMVNARISRVGIVTKSNFKSLMDHLGSGRDWDLARKGGGIVLLPPFAQAGSGIYRNRLEALIGTYEFVVHSQSEYFVISDCNYIFNADYAEAVKEHIRTGADITCLSKRMPLSAQQAADCVTFCETDGRLTSVRLDPGEDGTYLCGLNNYIMGKKFLIALIEHCRGRGYDNFEDSVLQAGVGQMKLMNLEVPGSVIKIGSLEQYYAASMGLLDRELRDELFSDHPVFTKVRDEMPAKYGLEAEVSDCLIADGCLLDGCCSHSVIFRGVRIEKGARVRNCILLQGTVVRAGAELCCVITDKNAVVSENRVLAGSENNPLFVGKGKTV